LLLPTATAQRLETHVYTESNGLPDGRVVDLDQTPDGRVWVASRGGVYAFDGNAFGPNLSSTDLPRNFVPNRLVADSRGVVWVIPEKLELGLLRLSEGSWEHLPVHGEMAELETPREVGLFEVGDAEHEIVVVTRPGLFAWAGDRWKELQRPEALRTEPILGMNVRGDRAYVATAAGVEVYQAGQSHTEALVHLSDPEDSVYAVLATDGGNGGEGLWVVTRDRLAEFRNGILHGVAEFDPGFAKSPPPRIRLTEDGTRGFWFGSRHNLYHFNLEEQRVRSITRAEGLASMGVSGFLHDFDGNLWVAGGRGLTRIPPQTFESYGEEQGLFDAEVTALLDMAPGPMVLGHSWGLSFVWPDDSVTVQQFGSPRKVGHEVGRIMEICRADSNHFWIAARDMGLGLGNSAGEVDWIDEVSASVNTVLVRGDGSLWVGADDGIWIRDPEGNYSHDESLGPIQIRRFGETSDGTLYAAPIHRGLLVHRDGKWEEIFEWSHTESPAVYAIFEDSQSRIWLGSDLGLLRMEGQRVEAQREGFRIDQPVYACLEDPKGALWFGTSRNLLRWNGRTLESFGQEEGLVGREVNRAALTLDSRDRLWVGTEGGASLFLDPPHRTPRPVEVVFDQVRWSDAGTLNWSDEPVAGYSDLEADFTAISFEGSGTCLYRARLEGYDQDWLPEKPVDEGSLRYTNLPPGEYKLEIQARTTDGDWGPSSVSAPFLVPAPVWERGWFLALGFGGLGTGLVVFVSMLLSRRHNTRLAEEVRSTHEALTGTTHRYSELFEHSPSILLLIEPGTGLVLEANIAAVQYFGNSRESLRQQNLSELTGLSQERLEEGFASLAAGQEWIVRPGEDDPVFGPPIEIRMRQLRMGDEETVQATIFDIEVQQHQEQERIESQKLRAVAELASGVAHDFNNLLTAILGHNELIELDAGSDVRVAAHVASIRSAGEKGANLVRQLLAFGRKHRLKVEELDFGSVIKGVSPLMQTVIGNDLKLVLELNEQDLHVLADRSELEEILMNLVLCARDALSTGGELRLAILPRIAPLGLPDGDPFPVGTELVQLSVTSAARTPGTTAAASPPHPEVLELALAAVHDLVSHWQGVVKTSRDPGDGIAIDVYLPARALHAPSSAPIEDTEDSETSHVGSTLLLVDDEPDVRNVISALLRSDGYRVLEAGNAFEALDVLKGDSTGVDLVLTDIQMPGETGRQLGARLEKSHPKLLVLYMSGYYDEALASEDDYFMSKPFTLAKFHRLLRQVPAR